MTQFNKPACLTKNSIYQWWSLKGRAQVNEHQTQHWGTLREGGSVGEEDKLISAEAEKINVSAM